MIRFAYRPDVVAPAWRLDRHYEHIVPVHFDVVGSPVDLRAGIGGHAGLQFRLVDGSHGLQRAGLDANQQVGAALHCTSRYVGVAVGEAEDGLGDGRLRRGDPQAEVQLPFEPVGLLFAGSCSMDGADEVGLRLPGAYRSAVSIGNATRRLCKRAAAPGVTGLDHPRTALGLR